MDPQVFLDYMSTSYLVTYLLTPWSGGSGGCGCSDSGGGDGGGDGGSDDGGGGVGGGGVL